MKKLFTSEKFFNFTSWFSIVGVLPYIVSGLIFYPQYKVSYVIRLFVLANMVVLYFSYKHHSKNVMKGMMGSILFGVVVLALIASHFEPNKVLAYVSICITIILYINHFVINSDHHSRPVNILLNQGSALVYAILLCIWGLSYVPSAYNAVDKICQIIMCFAQPCLMLSLVCVESKLDAYRLNRENAGWTEEKGYPEGYIHEYEKKK